MLPEARPRIFPGVDLKSDKGYNWKNYDNVAQNSGAELFT